MIQSRPPIRAGSLKRVFACLGLGLPLALALCGAQNTSTLGEPPSQGPVSRGIANSGIQYDEPSPMDEQRRLRFLNAERQKALVSDTAKLLRVATELDAEVKGTSPDTLTPAQLRKVAEIEKLAHSVKDKMSAAVGGGPVFHDPMPPAIR